MSWKGNAEHLSFRENDLFILLWNDLGGQTFSSTPLYIKQEQQKEKRTQTKIK